MIRLLYFYLHYFLTTKTKQDKTKEIGEGSLKIMEVRSETPNPSYK
jgi:hypothetical protein